MDKAILFKQIQQILLFKDYPHNITQTSHLRDNLHMDKFDMAVLRKEIEKKNIISQSQKRNLKNGKPWKIL